MDNGFISEEALGRIAYAVGIPMKTIYLSDIVSNMENAIEFVKDGSRATVTFSQGRYKSRIKKLAKSHPEKCEIVTEDIDGSLSWLG